MNRIELSSSEPEDQLPTLDVEALDEALDRLETIDLRAAQVVKLRFFAGLTGRQLILKLASFESSYAELEHSGGTGNLEQTLDKGGVILGSLAGAIPGFGSFAQELIDFILKEIKKRAKFWRKK